MSNSERDWRREKWSTALTFVIPTALSWGAWAWSRDPVPWPIVVSVGTGWPAVLLAARGRAGWERRRPRLTPHHEPVDPDHGETESQPAG